MQWFKNRVRSLGPVCSMTVLQEAMTYPPAASCIAINTAIATRHQFRASIFKVLRSLGSMEKGTYRNAFAVICRLLQYAEMGHIFFICTYLLKRHSEVLSFTDLMGQEKYQLSRAMDFLAQQDVGDAPYIKLLRRPEETDVLHSRLYKRFFAAAKAIAGH